MKKEKSRIYQEQASAIRERLGDRDYIIGIDPGVGSIGIAAVAVETSEEGKVQPAEIVYAGTRLYVSSENSSFRFEKRNLRNIRRHGKRRQERLWKTLASRGMMLPFVAEDEENAERTRFSESVLRSNPYELRYRGLQEELSPEELGYALYHMSNHRGFPTKRVFEDDDIETVAEGSKMFEVTEGICREHGVDTFIEVLRIFNSDGFIGYRNTISRTSVGTRMPIATRKLIENEFNRLMAVQQAFRPDYITDGFIAEIAESLFYENPRIDTVPGRCPHFPEEQRLPKASFINEERRLWEAVNNIRLVTPEESLKRRPAKFALDPDERKLLFDFLRKGESVTTSVFFSLFPHYRGNLVILPGTDRKTPKIKGFRFRSLEERPFFSAMTTAEQDLYITIFINTSDDEMLRSRLRTELSLAEEDIEWTLSELILIGDYAPVGRTAMEIVMNIIIEDGSRFSDARKQAMKEGLLPDLSNKTVYDFLPYYGEVLTSSVKPVACKACHPFFADKADDSNFRMPNTARCELEFGRIPNPVVHQSLNEIRKLINELIGIFGKKPIAISLEVGSQLKAGKSVRARMTRENAKRNKENQALFDRYCAPNNLGRNYIKVFRLLEEQNWTCPYSLGKISVADVVSGRVDVDHIFPLQESLDSTMSNLVVCDRYCNQVMKGKNIPSKAFGGDIGHWRAIMEYISSTPGMQEKKWRFEMGEVEYMKYLSEHSFHSRFVTDNAYIARVLCEYLRCLFPIDTRYKSVTTVKGEETAILRRAWSLNDITQKLRIVHSPGENVNGLDQKDRTDARHHALDAIVIAYCSTYYRKYIEGMAKLDVSHVKMAEKLPVPYAFRDENLSSREQISLFRDYVESFILGKTFVSRKVDTDTNGELIKDTRYKVLAETETEVLLVTRKPVKSIKAMTFMGNGGSSAEFAFRLRLPSRFTDVNEEEVRKMEEHNQALFARVLQFRDRAEEELILDHERRISQGLKVSKINEGLILWKALSMAGGKFYHLVPRKKTKVLQMKSGNTVFAQDTGENYCLDLYLDGDGVLQGEVIRKVNISRKGWIPEYTKKGYILFERLHCKDIIEVDCTLTENARNQCDMLRAIRTNNAPEERTFLCLKCFTDEGHRINFHVDSVNASKLNDNGTFSLNGLMEMNARKVMLSSAGLIVYRSKLLKVL